MRGNYAKRCEELCVAVSHAKTRGQAGKLAQLQFQREAEKGEEEKIWRKEREKSETVRKHYSKSNRSNAHRSRATCGNREVRLDGGESV